MDLNDYIIKQESGSDDSHDQLWRISQVIARQARYLLQRRAPDTEEDLAIFQQQPGARRLVQAIGDAIDSRAMMELTCLRVASKKPVRPIAKRHEPGRISCLGDILNREEDMLMACYRTCARGGK